MSRPCVALHNPRSLESPGYRAASLRLWKASWCLLTLMLPGEGGGRLASLSNTVETGSKEPPQTLQALEQAALLSLATGPSVPPWPPMAADLGLAFSHCHFQFYKCQTQGLLWSFVCVCVCLPTPQYSTAPLFCKPESSGQERGWLTTALCAPWQAGFAPVGFGTRKTQVTHTFAV